VSFRKKEGNFFYCTKLTLLNEMIHTMWDA
jgi:hypothetical protein